MRGTVYIDNQVEAGTIWEDQDGFHFQYISSYLNSERAKAVSLTLPLRSEKYKSDTLFPFFDGLIPEGWLLHIVEQNWKINPRDRMALLLASGRDCIGNISIIEDE